MPLGLGAPELLIILFVVVFLFGAKKLPDTARGLGRALRIFKSETKGMNEDDHADARDTTVRAEPPKQIPPAQTSETSQPTVQPSATSAPERERDER